MSRGHLAEDEHSRKAIEGRPSASRPSIVFLLWSSSAFPLAFQFAFKDKQMGLAGEEFNIFVKVLEPHFVQPHLARLNRVVDLKPTQRLRTARRWRGGGSRK